MLTMHQLCSSAASYRTRAQNAFRVSKPAVPVAYPSEGDSELLIGRPRLAHLRMQGLFSKIPTRPPQPRTVMEDDPNQSSNIRPEA
jgi:hypothetical protein